MRYLITKSLLDSWGYIFECSEGFEEDARASFMSSLLREKVEQTDAMLNGIFFENEVYAQAAGKPRNPNQKWENGIRKVANIIGNAPVQVRCSRELIVSEMTFLVYGILDVLKAGIIYDVKFSNKGLGSVDVYGKYLRSSQHPAYLYIVPEATEFQYLLSDGEDIYIERYTRDNTPFIGDIVSDFISWLKAENLLDTYKEKWIAR